MPIALPNSSTERVETCKLNDVDPQAYLTDVFTRLVAGHPINRLELLLPWTYAAKRA